MICASYRSVFFDVVSNLCDVARTEHFDGEDCWQADFAARNLKIYRFRGAGRSGEVVSEARELDVRSGCVQPFSPSLLTFVLLEFEANGLTAAYCGPRLPAPVIAEVLADPSVNPPEIVSVAIERRWLDDGRLVQVSTSFVFIGFARSSDADQVVQGGPLATSGDMVSPIWYRERMMLLGSKATALA